jgi:16S rRNA (cytidine1402-2'-O)-methyltransferase
MLILVATPIGNLRDISFRAIDALQNADLILCEDTRHSKILLQHYQIQKPLKSYHLLNERKKIDEIIQLLQEGKKLCLISDAGTPLISDPGFPLVQACLAAQIPVTSIPGPCAFVQALICSGMEWERFQFVGFLPKKEGALRTLLNEFLKYPGVTICYEAPHRIVKTLQILSSLNPNSCICLAKELTKIHESFIRATVSEALSQVDQEAFRGECVLLIKGEEEIPDYSSLSLEEHIQDIQAKYHVSKREAIKIVAEMRHLNKRSLYRDFSARNP